MLEYCNHVVEAYGTSSHRALTLTRNPPPGTMCDVSPKNPPSKVDITTRYL